MSCSANFGPTADDYAAFRAGFPAACFDRLRALGIGLPGQRVVDLGTGTGALARGLAGAGTRVVGIDPKAEMLAAARRLAEDEELDIAFERGSAERTGLKSAAFDAVVAGQCWHWFDGKSAFAEVTRLLKPAGRLAICHFDWLPLPDSLVAATEALILSHNPDWPLAGGTGTYPQWERDASAAGFRNPQTFSFDIDEPYTAEAWRGRIRASAGVGGSLPPEKVAAFDRDLAAMMAQDFPGERLLMPHRCWGLVCRRPSAR